MKITPRVPGGITLVAIGYKYNYRKVLEIIADEGGGITESGDHSLSRVPDIYSNFYVRPVFCTHLIGRNFNSCIAIYNQNSMCQSDLAL